MNLRRQPVEQRLPHPIRRRPHAVVGIKVDNATAPLPADDAQAAEGTFH